jgi:hypothetical protein
MLRQFEALVRRVAPASAGQLDAAHHFITLFWMIVPYDQFSGLASRPGGASGSSRLDSRWLWLHI